MLRRLFAVTALSLAAMGCGCVVHEGDGWVRAGEAAARGPDDGSNPTRATVGVSLVVVGAPAPGLTARQVARRLDTVLREERDAGRVVAVLWPGDNVFPAGLGEGPDCEATAAEAWSRRGVRDLAEVVRRAETDGIIVGSWGALGRRDWRCGAPELQLGERPEGQPFTVVDHHYVLRLFADQAPEVASACVGQACEVVALDPDGSAPLVELVFADQTPWVFPDAVPASVQPRGEAVEDQLDALVGALQAMDEAAVDRAQPSPPRVLVTQAAVESAGMHGQGGLRPAATVHLIHPAVRDAVTAGTVRGVLASLDRSLQLMPDLDPAMQRVAKIWIERPVFQVVSGAAGRPDARAPLSRRQYPWNQGIGAVPAFRSTLPGLAVVRIDPETTQLELQALRAGRWERARDDVPTRPEPLPRARPAPPMTPCPRCDPRDGAANR